MSDVDERQEDEDEEDEKQKKKTSRSRSSQRRGGRSRRRGRRYGRRRRISSMYDDENFTLSYKDPDVLRRFVTDHGKIRPRRQTGLYAKDQRLLAREVKRARHLALLPFTPGHTHSN